MGNRKWINKTRRQAIVRGCDSDKILAMCLLFVTENIANWLCDLITTQTIKVFAAPEKHEPENNLHRVKFNCELCVRELKEDLLRNVSYRAALRGNNFEPKNLLPFKTRLDKSFQTSIAIQLRFRLAVSRLESWVEVTERCDKSSRWFHGSEFPTIFFLSDDVLELLSRTSISERA